MPETPGAVNPGARRADDLLGALAARGIRPGTATTERVLEALGDPHSAIPTVLIAGTNGKGSTAALLASAASTAGYRVGRFTSPALWSATEQIEIDRVPVDGERLASTLREVIGRGEEVCPGRMTAFEALTAAALSLFAQDAVELAVLEAGLGGKGDATNVVDAIVAVLTNVAFDHREWLGDDLRSIAREKAGIFRPGRAAVIGWLDPIAAEAAGRAALRAKAAPCFAAEAVRSLSVEGRGLAPQRVRFATERAAYDVELPLLGAHQAQNLALATLASEQLAAVGFARLGALAIQQGAATCRWPGRLEPFVLPDGTEVVVDGAHNERGAQRLGSFLGDLGRPVSLVFAAYADKDAGAMLAALAPLADRMHLAPLDEDRSWAPDDTIADRIVGETRVHKDFAAALTYAHGECAGVVGRLVVVCGSLRTVALCHRWVIDQGARPYG